MDAKNALFLFAVAMAAAALTLSVLPSPMALSLLPIVLVSGFLDGLHPCGFAVLLFFIAFLFTLKRSKAQVFRMGVAYIAGVFLAYFLIGLLLLQALLALVGINLTSFWASLPKNAMAKAAAYLLIALGAINIKDYFFYGRWLSLRMPGISKRYVERIIHRSTLPAAFVAGFLVGICAFPCAGGIYIAIITMLTANASAGIYAYLLLYNLMFVMPLILALLLASNRHVIERISAAEESNKKYIKLVSGIVMVAIALFILFSGVF